MALHLHLRLRLRAQEREKMERAEQNRRDITLANEYQRQLKAIKREEEKAEEDQVGTLVWPRSAAAYC